MERNDSLKKLGLFIIISLILVIFAVNSKGIAQESLPETVERLEQDLSQALTRITELETLIAELIVKLEGTNSLTMDGDGGTTPSNKQIPGVASIEEGGLSVKIHSCSKANNQVSCNLSVMSEKQDQSVCFDTTTVRAWGIGVDYRGVLVSIGSESSYYTVCNEIIKGIPMNTTLILNANPSPGSELARMDLTYTVSDQPYTVSFTSIPVQ